MVIDSKQVLKGIFNAFDPFRPLNVGDPAYVNCQEVRGNNDILIKLGTEIEFSDRMTCRIYTGHRGAGKTTELLRLKKYLEDNHFYVVYFSAEEDIDVLDAQYTDILLACTRHLLQDLKKSANPDSLLNWLRDRWNALKDLALTEIAFDSLSIEAQIAQFSKLTTTLRAIPSARQKIRQEVDCHTITLTNALNEFITEAKCKLPNQSTELVLIVDSLDRIVPVYDENSKRLNHEQIFIDRSEQLKSLNCHLIYTCPLSLRYGDQGTVLEQSYDNVDSLPMIMVRKPNGEVYDPGIKKLNEMIVKRIESLNLGLSLEDIFEDQNIVRELCLISGGHTRNLMFLMKTTARQAQNLPILVSAMQSAISELRNTYRTTVRETEWSLLAEVYRSKKKPNNFAHDKLVHSRCIVEYHLVEEGNSIPWYDVHPLIIDIDEFQQELRKKQKVTEDKSHE